MRYLLVLVLLIISVPSLVGAVQNSELTTAAGVLNEIASKPESSFPEEVLASAKCLGVVSPLLLGGFVFGGAHGTGFITCRRTGDWSAPAPVRILGGAFDLKISSQGVNLVMVLVTDKAVESLQRGRLKLGSDASATAGPVRSNAGSIVWRAGSDVLVYLSTQGVLTGVSASGAVITQDKDVTRKLYGTAVALEALLAGSIPTPQSAGPFLQSVREVTGVAASDVAAAPLSAETLAAWRAAGAKVELPEEALRHKVLAETALQEKNLRKASAEYGEALKLYPTWPEGQFNIALILGELHRYTDAISHMKTYLALVPDAPDAQKAKQQIWIWEDKAR